MFSVFLLHSAFFILPSVAADATNSLSGLLQQGLFEEEANRNLPAAIEAYESLTRAFDQDRRLAATAVFRLGECYRKLGQTNEAAASYERILSDFADEEMLVTLSRQNLAGMGMSREEGSSVESVPGIATGLSPEAQELARTKATIAQLEGWDLSQLRRLIPEVIPDAEFDRINELLRLNENYGATASDELLKQRDEYRMALGRRANDIMELLRKRAGDLKAVVAEQQPGAEAIPIPVITNEEAQEIRRLQEMIKNSPDLINLATGEDRLSPLGRAASAGQMRVAEFLLDNGAMINAPNGGSGRIRSEWPPLFMAADSGHKAMAELLISRGADVAMRTSDGNTPLRIAAKKGFRAVAEVLLTNGADPTSALPDAAWLGQTEIVRLLLDHGADVNARDSADATALILATSGRHSETARVLIAANADPAPEDQSGRTALSYAAERCDLETVKALLAAKADPNAGTLNLPLHGAVFMNSEAVVEALLKAGADPNRAAPAKLPAGSSTAADFGSKVVPLYLAMYNGRTEVVRMLLDHGADPNGAQPDGTPLIFAALGNQPEILESLLAAGAKPNVQDRDGEYPLTRVARMPSPNAGALADLLLGHGANPEITVRGFTPLILATSVGSEDTAAVLLKHGADVNRPDLDGRTALHYAVDQEDIAKASLLLGYKADVNARGPRGYTPLHYAVQTGTAELVRALLDAGADPNVRNDEGQTPLDLAESGSDPHGVARVVSMRQAPGLSPRPPVPPRSGSYALQTGMGSEGAKSGEITALLREHGALDELPDWNSIRVTRQGLEQPIPIFRADTNGWNRFTLIEAVERLYSMGTLTIGGISSGPSHFFGFPDLSRLVIHRPPKSPGGKGQDIEVNLLTDNNRIGCGNDVPLRFGDVVEISVRDHSLSEAPIGLTTPQQAEMRNCLKGKVRLEVKDRSVEFDPLPTYLSWALIHIEAQSLLLSSSDLSRVKVTRADPETGEISEFLVDATAERRPADDLWLRDGDVIEVPEKQ